MVLSTLEEKNVIFKNISKNSLEELLGIIPPPNLIYAVAFSVKQSQLIFGSFLQLSGKILD